MAFLSHSVPSSSRYTVGLTANIATVNNCNFTIRRGIATITVTTVVVALTIKHLPATDSSALVSSGKTEPIRNSELEDWDEMISLSARRRRQF